jgi:hypothetical protein
LGSSFSTGTAEFEFIEHNGGVPPPVPSLGGMGLVLLAGGLAAIGYWSHRRS